MEQGITRDLAYETLLRQLEDVFFEMENARFTRESLNAEADRIREQAFKANDEMNRLETLKYDILEQMKQALIKRAKERSG